MGSRRSNRPARRGSERRGRGALPADVAEHKSPVVGPPPEDVVEVATDPQPAFAGEEARSQLHARDCRWSRRQQARLQDVAEPFGLAPKVAFGSDQLARVQAEL